MSHLRFFLLLFCCFQFLQAQQFPLDFENNQFGFTGFSGSSFSFGVDPVLAGNNVGQFNNNGSQANQGFFIDVTTAVDLNTDQNISLRFYSFDPNVHTILLKLENGTQPAVEVSQQIPSGANSWNDVNFDFSNATDSGTGNAFSSTGQYDRVTLFIDFGAATSGTYLFDQINNGAVFVPPNPIDVLYTDLVWSDEFNASGNNPIDATNWFHQTQLPAGGNWFNNEEQHYTNRIDNSFVENGFLNIVAKRENFRDQGHTKQFTSARLNSKFAFTYGRVDVRAKLPFGDGTWPAIWTLGKNINEDGAYWDAIYGTTNWPLCGEIDIMEHGLGALNHVSAALHTNCAGCSGNTRNFRSTTLPDVANNFHIYSMNWSPQQITFLIDDVPFYTYNPAIKDVNTYPFYEDQYLILNIAMGGVSGTIDPNFNQSSMVIDYVRVYQNTLGTVSEDENKANLKVYPNPATDTLHIETTQIIDKVALFDLAGKLVFSESEQTNRLDVTKLKPGLYLVKIYSNQIVLNRKIFIK
jgi:beta-glucanase (GH16 family)